MPSCYDVSVSQGTKGLVSKDVCNSGVNPFLMALADKQYEWECMISVVGRHCRFSYL